MSSRSSSPDSTPRTGPRSLDTESLETESLDTASLDPEDWEAFRALAHRAVDDLIVHWRCAAAGEGPVWHPVAPASRELLDEEPLPVEGQGADAVYRDFVDHVLPFGLGNVHPRFWGWVIGSGTPLGALADFLAAGLNPNVGGMEQSATRVERRVIRWLDQALGFDAGEPGSGLLTSGGSAANLVALAVARDAGAGLEVRDRGLQVSEAPALTVHGSRETHSSVLRALDVLGLGRGSFRPARTRRDGSVDPAALARALAKDRARGVRPIALVANAGTVRTGAIDDLRALADLAEREGLWLHVDGAFGALAALSPALRPRLAGLERADSLAFDLHKWANLPYGVGCALVRNAKTHRATFHQTADYLAAVSGGPAARGAPSFGDLGFELSRPFRALKVWMALKTHGVRGLARTIERNVEQTRRLAEKVSEHPRLQRLAPPEVEDGLNIVCFRYRPGSDPAPGPKLGQAALNRLNETILVGLQEDGVAVPSAVTLGGRFCLRVALVGHRTRIEDLELLLAETVRRGDALAARTAC